MSNKSIVILAVFLISITLTVWALRKLKIALREGKITKGMYGYYRHACFVKPLLGSIMALAYLSKQPKT